MRKVSARKRTAELQLDARLDATAKEGLHVAIDLFNPGATPIYVFNVLWNPLDGKWVRDPEQAYRFVTDDDTLTVIIGAAPMPSDPVYFKNVPYVTTVAPGASLQLELTFKHPIMEYSCYFGPLSKATSDTVTVRNVVVVVDYLVDRPDLKTKRSLETGDALWVESRDALQRVVRLATDPVELELEVEKRTDWFERPTR